VTKEGEKLEDIYKWITENCKADVRIMYSFCKIKHLKSKNSLKPIIKPSNTDIEEEIWWNCDKCNEGFENIPDLIEHVKKIHEKEIQKMKEEGKK